jgi:hypothetical protein
VSAWSASELGIWLATKGALAADAGAGVAADVLPVGAFGAGAVLLVAMGKACAVLGAGLAVAGAGVGDGAGVAAAGAGLGAAFAGAEGALGGGEGAGNSSGADTSISLGGTTLRVCSAAACFGTCCGTR